MAQYPIEISDNAAIAEGLNYVLSGPAGLGQNFAGFSASGTESAYLRGTTRQPFTVPIVPPATSDTGPQIYNFIPISGATGCLQNGTPTGSSTRFFKLTFTTPQTTAPYSYGDQVDVQGVNPSFYNDTGYLVWSCSTTEIICYTSGSYVWPAYVSGGEVGSNWLNYALSTDANARVTVTGASDRVFVSAQCNMRRFYYSFLQAYDYTTVTIRVRISRYKGYVDTSPGATDYLFANPVTVSEQFLTVQGAAGAVPSTFVETKDWIFTTVVDQPDPGYYWYILEFYFDTEHVEEQASVSAVDITSGTKVVTASPVSYTGLATTTSGTGAGCTVDVSLTASASEPYSTTNTTVTIATGGNDYDLADTITVAGTALGGASPANDLVLTVTNLVSLDTPKIKDVWLGVRSLSAQVVKE